jgi:uncharacterized protein YdeI (YjbR/CyaY-like superfamily)
MDVTSRPFDMTTDPEDAMGSRDARVDAYIANAAAFAQPILRHLREIVHAACPDVEETIKWSFPHFTYHGILCSMASFKEHCAFGFWNGSLIVGAAGEPTEPAMGQFGRITSLKDLPSKKTITGYIKQAMKLNEAGIKPPARSKPVRKKNLPVPEELTQALQGNRKARATYEGFSPSRRQEYVEWITEAKGEDTRKKRLDTAIAWMAEGKPRFWKYMK